MYNIGMGINAKDLRIVFMGTPEISAGLLRTLFENKFNVVAVVAQPDKPVGRKGILQKVPTKVIAEEFGVPVYQPIKIRKDYEFLKEIKKFEATVSAGIKEFEKTITGMERKNAFMSQKDPSYVPETEISGKQAFRLYDTYGFPIEMTTELAAEKGLTVDMADFEARFKQHQETSHAGAEQRFKGGLAEQNEVTARLHTATHLLNAALKSVLNDSNINQKGSNITTERLRFDFNFERKLTPEELKAVEAWVNEAIAADVEVTLETMTYEQAKEAGAIGVFTNKYGEEVKVYTIGKYSKEICGGPHAAHTGELHHFKIAKEEASSAGVRRIKAVLD